MKKILFLLLSCAICLSFSGCVDSDTPQKESINTNSKVEETEQTFGLNESAVFKDLKFTAVKLEESDGVDFFTPEKGNVFVGVKFEIENISDEDQNVSTLLLFEGYVDNVKCSYSISASCAFNEGTLDGSIAPGKKLIGWYAIEVPENWGEIELQVQSDWLSSNSAKFIFRK